MTSLRSLVFFLLAIVACFVHAQQLQVPAHITIHEQSYALELQKNSALGVKSGAAETAAAGQHFRGRLSGEPDSWVRLSAIEGHWTGIVSLAGEKYIIEASHDAAVSTASENNKRHSSSAMLLAKPASVLPGLERTECAVGTSTAGLLQKTHSALVAPNAKQVEYSALCATSIDGVCLLAEVEFVFDQSFQQVLSNAARSTANAIVNMAEGFYQNDLNIAFDTITMEFPTGEVFSTTTDASILLDDMATKKRSGRLAFVKNSRALLHLITGRTFNGGTAGIAFTRTLCQGDGFGSGTSKLLSRFGRDQAPLTALVIAHEIGHNFGADHDDEGNNCGRGHIMQSQVHSSISDFSACSVSSIDQHISAVNEPQHCFNFPVDVSISATGDAVSEATAGQAFTTEYSVAVATAYLAAPQLQVEGAVTAGQASFVSATLNGAACVVASDGGAYLCTGSDSGAAANLQVVAVGTGGAAASFSHTASTGGSADLLESNETDNRIETSLTLKPAPPAAGNADGGAATENETIAIGVAPGALANESQMSDGGGGGGGGSIGQLSLLFLLITFLRRETSRQPILSALPE